MLDWEETNTLGNIIDTTWGKSSTNDPKSKTFTSCKVQFLGKPIDGETQLLMTYTCLTSFGSVSEREAEMKKASGEGNEALKACLSKIKEEFKSESGRTLKTKQLSEDDDWELVNMGAFNGRRDSFYRKKIIIEVS